MTVFLDSNIILDIFLKTPEFYDESKKILTILDTHSDIDFFISASSVTDIFYILNKKIGDKEKTKQYLSDLMDIVSIAGIDETCIKNAMNSSWKDFEDSVQYESAVQIRSDYLVTRNIKDYKSTFVKVITPSEFLEKFK